MRRHGYLRADLYLIGLLALLLGILGNGDRAFAIGKLSDQGISDHIEDELMYDAGVGAASIDVSTISGIVTLKGTTNNILAKRRAARIAETVKGVRSVINRIDVKAASRPDGDIARDVELELARDPAAEAFEIDVEVNDGKVTLTGETQSWQEKRLCGLIASNVKGVQNLENDITLNYAEERSDSELEAEIEQTLRWNIFVDHGLIRVEVEDGAVELSGTVGSAAEKSMARQSSFVTGVKSVSARELNVAKWARDKNMRKDKYAVKQDDKIKDAVNMALALDPRILSRNVTATVTGGMITLRGTVDNIRAKRAAAQDARNTAGVLDVDNRIRVRFDKPENDNELVTDINEALGRNALIGSRDRITVAVTNGVATLYGEVNSFAAKREAEDVASRTRGIVDVRNRLDVDYDLIDSYTVYDPFVDDDYLYDYGWYGYDYTPVPNPSESDAEIKAEIYDELFWSPFVDANQVEVSVISGIATLTGTVNSWAERQSAAENAREGGATSVVNKISVDPDA